MPGERTAAVSKQKGIFSRSSPIMGLIARVLFSVAVWLTALGLPVRAMVAGHCLPAVVAACANGCGPSTSGSGCDTVVDSPHCGSASSCSAEQSQPPRPSLSEGDSSAKEAPRSFETPVASPENGEPYLHHWAPAPSQCATWPATSLERLISLCRLVI